ncbi:MAG: RsmF rRNA methyltransferase first C-terminal domain-containing protein [Lachnospiraceae bacterium]|nr:RsmF rRNA methyltransferase first C-terminal domain-containing protein [Lachnospiraceae bacterium]
MVLPEEYENRMKAYLGEADFRAYLGSLEEKSLRALRVNTLKLSEEEFLSLGIPGIGQGDRVPWCPEGFYYEETEQKIGDTPAHHGGFFYIQEPSAMAPAEALGVRPGERVLDLCSAPGGKGTALAAKMENRGLLVLNEPVPSRAKILSENTERMGIANALVLCGKPEGLSERFPGFFDRVLVDAPCSGEGMFRKNPGAVAEWSGENVLLCAKRQKDILVHAVRMLSPGGRLVYSTCTFNPGENEENTAFLLKNFPELTLLEEKKLLPWKIRGEGQYYSVFEKTGREGEDPGKKTSFSVEKPPKERELKAFFEFASGFLRLPKEVLPGGRFVFIGDGLYVMPGDVPGLSGLRVLRAGLHLGTIRKDRFEPSHALFLYLKKEDTALSAELSEEEAVSYLAGESVRLSDKDPRSSLNGWCLLLYKGKSIGGGKINQGMIKNHYPKGLRIRK